MSAASKREELETALTGRIGLTCWAREFRDQLVREYMASVDAYASAVAAETLDGFLRDHSAQIGGKS